MDDPWFESIDPLQMGWYLYQIAQDEEEAIERKRFQVEYGAAFIFGEDIQKMWNRRAQDKMIEQRKEDAEIAAFMGIGIEEAPMVSGLSTDFGGESGTARGQDPFYVLKSLRERESNNTQCASDSIVDDIFNSELDEVVVIRPDPNSNFTIEHK